ncbi:E3 ubiquitin-protein ligase HUWE1 [Nematocida minor]|uniref:E3 ubiquitin-protein ligase HUWE1 n=1 Tax=Nematocida minor TaxID=1912983 RepID=UPI002220CE53|nr:E3 ubiquitin-protein ligase HUWE1 [Nematocida minor]KAI5190406.1 E3 ubiquitin-protein ligase HUWE1 [Nematocida minor]
MKIERPIERRFSQPPENISNIIRHLTDLPEEDIYAYLNNLKEWKYTKTDLLYWVDVLDRFDAILKNISTTYSLEQFQNHPMKETDKETVHAILQFQKLLVENSSNKSLFSSFDVIEPYIYSFELELVVDALYLVSFFASKIHIQRSIKTSMNLMKMDTLKILIERVKEKPHPIYTYYDEHTNTCKRVNIKKAVKKGLYGLSDKTVPKQEIRRFIHAIRSHELIEQLDKLKIIRLLAFSALVYYNYSDLPIDSEFISRDIPETLNIINTESYKMREAAVVMIDAIFRMRIRHSAVIAAMNAQSHEGMIMNLLKHVINEDVPEHFSVAFFNFLSSCFASAPCVSALFSAGIVQYVCNTLKDRSDISYRKKMRLVMGANTFLFTLPAPFTWFISENGVGILSKELLKSVETVLGNLKDHDLLLYINSIMKIISQLFKNIGTVEAMRGFLEGEFPRAINLVLFHSDEFTPSILAYLFSAVADYIHNEPSNLPFIIEAGIFDGFVECMKKELPASPDLLLELPNLIEAFFLNSELIKKIETENILDKIFQSFEMINLCNTILSYDIARTYGIFLENLVRHYPVISSTVKEKIYNTMKNLESLIPHTEPELMLLLLENLFRMVHRAVYRKTTNNQLITDKGLLNNRIITMLTLIEIPPDTELYTDVMSILTEVFSEDQAYVISYIVKFVDRTMKNKITLENIERIKRILLIANYLLFRTEEINKPFVKHCTSKGFLQIIKRISQYFNSLKDKITFANKQYNETLINLYYSFTLGILKNSYTVKDATKQYLKIFDILITEAIEKTNQKDFADYATHMHGIKNYLLLDKDTSTYPSTHYFSVTHDYLIGRNISKILQDHAKALICMQQTMDPLVVKKAVSSILEVLSIYSRGISNLFVPNAQNAQKSRNQEIEEDTLIITELLLSYIDKNSIEHLLSIVKTAFYLTLKKKIPKETERENENTPEYKRRDCLGSFFISVFLSLPKEETENVLNADIFTILVKNKKTFKQVYNKQCYDLLRYAAVKEYNVYMHLFNYLPEMVGQVGESKDPSFLQLFSMVLTFTAMKDTLKKTNLLSRAAGEIRMHETADAAVLEAQGIVLLAVVKLKIEYELNIVVEDPMGILNRMYAALENSESKESLLILINLIIRRMTESREAVSETVETIIKSKHVGKFRMYTTHTTCSNLRSTIFYSISTFLRYIADNFEYVNLGWDDIRHKLPDDAAQNSNSTGNTNADSLEITEAALETLSDGLFTKKIKVYPNIKTETFGILFKTASDNVMERIARTHSLCLLVSAFPQLLSSLDESDYAHLDRHLQAHAGYAKSLKQSQVPEEEKSLAHWSGHLIIVIFNYSTCVEIKSYLLKKILSMLSESVTNTVIFSELIQELLVTRFSKNTFEENTKLIKKMNALDAIIKSTMEIDERRKDYSKVIDILTRPIEYITRILAVDETEAFYEEVSQSEEEVFFEDIDEGYMEDFDTDETMDSDQVVYDDTEEHSHEIAEESTEDSQTVYTSESNNYEEYVISEEEEISESQSSSSEPNKKNEFLKSLNMPSTSKLLVEEMDVLLDGEKTTFVQKILESIVLSTLQEKEPMKEPLKDSADFENNFEDAFNGNDEETLLEIGDTHSEDTDYEEYGDYNEEYEDEESFATGEEIVIGDENGEVPVLDVEILNNLPLDILEDTVFQFYQDRIASSTEYRPISLHFLNRLREEVRSLFEEQETRYMETFAGEAPRREEKKKKVQEIPFIAERDASASVAAELVAEFIRMILQCTNRRHLYRILHNISANKSIRESVVSVLVGSISQISGAVGPGVSGNMSPFGNSSSSNINANYNVSPGSALATYTNSEVLPDVIVKRSYEALTYLCTKSSDFTTVFSGNVELINQILNSMSKRTLAESTKLISTLGDGFKNDRVSENDHSRVNIQKFIELLEYDMTDDTFTYFSDFISKTEKFYRMVYLNYLMAGSARLLDEYMSRKNEFNSQTNHKSIMRLVRMVSLVAILGVTDEHLDGLLNIREMPFWAHYFSCILPRERESLFPSSLLPMFKAFIIVHSIEKYVGRNSENVNEFAKITTEPSIYHAVIEQEKDLINSFIQADPDLLFMSFSGLQKKILDFDNKRIFFYKKIRGSVQQKTTVPLMVQRGAVFEDTFHQLMRLAGEQVRHAKFNIKFVGEEGVDAGGLTREWYSELSKEMFNPNYALFTPIGASYQPNHNSHINPEHLVYFKFIGRIIGKAVYDEMTVDCHFTRAFYKRVLDIPVDLSDVETLDPEFYRSLVWILENDIENVLEMTFSMEQDRFGITEIIDLKENGRNIALTNHNKREYVELICGFKLVRVVERQLAAFIEGFFEILDRDLLKMFNEKEVELLISGLPEIDVDDWRNNSIYIGYTSESQVIRWYWRAVRNFSMEERAKLLQFATGTSKLPLEGFAGLRCQNGNQKFQIHKASGSSTRLPTAHTCFNQLDLPEYDSYEQLVKALLFSIEECSSGFGFA